MKKKPVQYFTKEYLKRCSKMTPDQILEFLENYRQLVSAAPETCRLISLKIEPSLLNAFRNKAELEGVAYQTQIKRLMKEWLIST